MNNPAHARQRNAIAVILVDADLVSGDDPDAPATYERIRRAVTGGAGVADIAHLFVDERLVDVVDPWTTTVAGRVVQAVRSEA